MERESFEDPAVAEVMNENFVCIKVDREERPDIDSIYMDAAQAMTGQGGWPLNAFLTPEGVPFFAGTYFPPQPRYGSPSWSDVLKAIADAWKNRRDEIEEQASQIIPRLQGLSPQVADGHDPQPSANIFEQALATLRADYDPIYGGFGGAPKFPPHSTLLFLLARGEHEMVFNTLRAMATGGIYDQIGGGFARYAVDENWTVPHFEKMLYDNALLARIYLYAWQVTKDQLFLDVCTGTLDWALKELRQPEGGFASALDADSEGEEGKFYLWTVPEITEVLGDELSQIAVDFFGVTEQGNFEGKNILVMAGLDRPDELDRIKTELYRARSERVWPGLDDKRITSWNALLISALAEAGAVLERSDYIDAAISCANFLESDLRSPDGALLRTFNRGRAKLNAYLEDYAYMLEAQLALYQSTFDPVWFERAQATADQLITNFGDDKDGGFFSTASDHEELIVRRKEITDTPIPAGASSAALGLLKLGALTEDSRYEEIARETLTPFTPYFSRHPQAFSYGLLALDFSLARVQQVALLGDPLRELTQTIYRKYRPHIVLVGETGGARTKVPLLENRSPQNGRPTAYVCEHFTCKTPVTEAKELAALLD
jgi:uncharacterized protein YyaL (SSP411 family)